MVRKETGFIPASEETERDRAAVLRQDAGSSGSKQARPRILVVDNEQLLADTTVEILERFGFETRVAYDGETALDIVKSFHPEFVLTDVLMPKMNGVELAISVRKISPASRILLFSGQAGISEILEEGREQGYEFELVAKPIHPMKLVERIKNALIR